jgi:hypothetical protein
MANLEGELHPLCRGGHWGTEEVRSWLKITQHRGAGRVAQVVEHLSSNPSTTKKKKKITQHQRQSQDLNSGFGIPRPVLFAQFQSSLWSQPPFAFQKVRTLIP